MEDESTSEKEKQAGKEKKVKRPAYMSLEAKVKDVASVETDEVRPKKKVDEEKETVDEGGIPSDENEVAEEENDEDTTDDGVGKGNVEQEQAVEPEKIDDREIAEEKEDGEEQDGPATPDEKMINDDGEVEGEEDGKGIEDEEDAKETRSTVVKEPTMSKTREAKDGAGDEKTGVEQNPSWHEASRDWKICSAICGVILILFTIVIFQLDIFHNNVIVLFIGTFLAFIAIILIIFLKGVGNVTDYQARFFFYKYEPDPFMRLLKEAIASKESEDDIEIENIEPVSGHTFGLLIPRETWKLSTGEILEVNLFKGTFASFFYGRIPTGMTLGLYLLLDAPMDSPLWGIIEEFVQKKEEIGMENRPVRRSRSFR